MKLPQDPFMLLSFVNMKLRDGDYENLQDLCAVMNCDEEEIISKLKTAGFEYNEDLRQFR